MTDDTWHVYGVKRRIQFRRFVKHLYQLFSADHVLTFGYGINPVKLAECAEVTIGGWDGWWYVVNIPVIREKLADLYQALEDAPEAYFEPFHFYVSKDGQKVVYADDRGQYSIDITSDVPEEMLRDFCQTVPCLYERSSEAGLTSYDLPEADVWEVKLLGGSYEFLRQLHLLIPEGAAMAIPVWTNPRRVPPGWRVEQDLLDFLAPRQLLEKYINPLIEEGRKVETLLVSLTCEADWDPDYSENYPDEVHVDASRQNLEELADLVSKWPAGLDPFYVYWSPDPTEGIQLGLYVHVGPYVVLAHDAEESVLLVACDVPEEQVRAFCNAVGAQYRHTAVKTIVGSTLLVKVT